MPGLAEPTRGGDRGPIVAAWSDGGLGRPEGVVQKAGPVVLGLMSGGLGSRDGYRILATLSESGRDAEADPTSVYSLIRRATEAPDAESIRQVLEDVRGRLTRLRDEDGTGTDPRSMTVALMVCIEFAPRATGRVGGGGQDGDALNRVLQVAQAAAMYSPEWDLRMQLGDRIFSMAVRPRSPAGSGTFAALMRQQMNEAEWLGDAVMLEHASRLWLETAQPRSPAEQQARERLVSDMRRRVGPSRPW